MITKINIDELTGLRGIAALLIILHHVLLLYPVLRNHIIGKCLGCFGYMGMDLFFILSGFVICYNYAEKIKSNPQQEILKFLVARIARIYPLYILFIGFFFVKNLIFFYNNTEFIAHNIISLPIFISGMQSWFYGFIGNDPIVHMQGDANISWSISTEFALYLFFIPFVGTLLKLNSKKTYIFSIISLIVVQLLWLVYSNHSNFISTFLNNIFGLHSNYTPSEWLTYHSPLARIWQFFTGCVIARYYTSKIRECSFETFRLLRWLSVLAIVIFVIDCPYLDISYHQYLSMPLLTIFVLTTVHSGNKFFKSRIFIFLGEISYSSYLLHIIYVPIFRYNGNHILPYVVNLPVFLICTYLTAFIVYKHYEMPMRKKVKDFLLNI